MGRRIGRATTAAASRQRMTTTPTRKRGGTRAWAGRFGKRRTTTKTTETSRDYEHKEDVATRSKSETLCKGEPLSSLSTARPKRRLPETTVARAGRADPSRTKQSRTGRRWRQRRNGGCVGDDNDYERLPYIQRRDDAHNNIIFIKKHIICLIFCN